MAAPPIQQNQYLVFTGYVGPDQANVTQTWLLPPGAAYNAATPAVALAIPFLYIGKGPRTSGQLFKNADFDIELVVLEGATQPTQKDVNITVQLTGTNAWNTAPTARATLRQNFLTCIQQIESQFELSASPILLPGATSIIAAAIVQNMPLPITEVLMYACGLDSGIGTGNPPAVDVMPGMRLRCEPSLRQYVAPPSQAFSGYVASGSLSWDVVSSVGSGTQDKAYGTQVQAFDAFLGAVASPQITPPPVTPPPFYSLIDLQLANGGFKYYRLIYPQNVITGVAPGDLSDQKNIQLVGANTLTALSTNPPFKRIFFGRDLLIPEICIWLAIGGSSYQACHVPIGTTVNNMLERFTRWKPLSQSDAQGVINLQRFAYSPSQAGSQIGVSVWFAPPPAPAETIITDLRALNLPLCAGDALSLSFLPGA